MTLASPSVRRERDGAARRARGERGAAPGPHGTPARAGRRAVTLCSLLFLQEEEEEQELVVRRGAAAATRSC